MIDNDDLARHIRNMSVRSNLYKTLKRELTALGYWKNRSRGKYQKGKMNA
jgi:protein associated with RNAse G/E